MELETVHLLEALLLPPGGLLVLGLLSLLLIRRAAGKLLLVLTLALFYAASIPATNHYLALALEPEQAITIDELKQSGAQALLVLMAGAHPALEFGGEDAVSRLSMDRISYAAWLHQRTALPIMLSGGAPGTGRPPLAETGAAALRELFHIQARAVETTSATTWENLEHSKPILDQHKIGRIAVVTHAWHMRRSLFSAQANGIDAVGAPTFFISRPDHPFGRHDWIPSSGALQRTRYLLHEHIGLLWYRHFNS